MYDTSDTLYFEEQRLQNSLFQTFECKTTNTDFQIVQTLESKTTNNTDFLFLMKLNRYI